MTTPTREQVMQWAKESCGDMRLTGAVFFGADELYIFVEKAIADLESTIAEKDAEIRELRMSRKMREDTIAEQDVALGTLRKEALWVRGKLQLPPETNLLSGEVTLAGTLHNVWAGYRGYQNYILAEKCDDKSGEIARQSVTIAEQAAEIERLKGDYEDGHNSGLNYSAKPINNLRQQLTAEQDKVKLLTEALETFMAQYPHMVKGYLLDAMDAVKEGK